MQSGVAAAIGPACRQVNDGSPFWSARFDLRRFRCFLVLQVTDEQLRKRDLHEASVLDRRDHFFMRLLRVAPSGRNGKDFGVLGMPDPRLMWRAEVHWKQPEFEAAKGCL